MQILLALIKNSLTDPPPPPKRNRSSPPLQKRYEIYERTKIH